MKYLPYKRNDKDNLFDKFVKQLERDRENFEVISTNYTHKLLSQYGTIMFNEDGREDKNLLTLINQIRSHNKKHIDPTGEKLKAIPPADYFKLFHFDKNKTVDCYKIDISQAYWKMALNADIITKEINETFENIKVKRLPKMLNWQYEEYKSKYKKQTRLKSLGSLATTKTFKTWKDGILLVGDGDIKQETEKTKHIYMQIHTDLDEIMKALSLHFDCFYYYVDCFFAKDKKIVDALRSLGFNCTIEKTKIKTEVFFKALLMVDLVTGKRYNIRKEDFDNIQGLKSGLISL